MKSIPLTRGKVALVDDDDYEHLAQFRWHAVLNGRVWYAERSVRQPRPGTIQMHSMILDAPAGMLRDHINGDGLDNRRENLRLCTKAENAYNAKKHKDNSVGFKGVRWHKRTKRFEARITVGGKQIFLGNFIKAEDAARAYDEAAEKHFGRFAHLNFPRVPKLPSFQGSLL